MAVAVVLAACLGGSPPESTVPDPAPLLFTVPVRLGEPPIRSPEPIIETLGANTLFVAAIGSPQDKPNQMTGASWLWRSDDSGVSWSAIRSPSLDTTGGTTSRGAFSTWDVDVRASDDGWIHYTDWWTVNPPIDQPGGGPGNLLVESSSDGGLSWSSVSLTIPEPTLIDRQWLLTAPGGLVGLFWSSSFEVANVAGATPAADPVMALKAVFSNDHGATWSTTAPVTIAPPVPGVVYQIARPLSVAGGPIILPYTKTPGIDGGGRPPAYWVSPTTIEVALSHDQGATWTHQTVAEAPEGLDNMFALAGAADDAGNAYLAWSAREGTQLRVFTTTSRDGGQSWDEPRSLSGAGFAMLPWVAAFGDGTVAIAWYAAEGSGRTEDAPPDTAWWPRIALRRGTDSFVSADASAEPVKRGPWCAKGNNCVDAADTNELREFLSAAFDGDGRLHAAYAESVDAGGIRLGLARYVAEAP